MKLETGELEAVPILLVQALVQDGEIWTIELHLHDGTVREGELVAADWEEVRIQDESGDEPWGETHLWDDVAKVVVP